MGVSQKENNNKIPQNPFKKTQTNTPFLPFFLAGGALEGGVWVYGLGVEAWRVWEEEEGEGKGRRNWE